MNNGSEYYTKILFPPLLAIQLLLNPLSVVAAIANCILIWRTTAFLHRSLKFLLICESANVTVYSLVRCWQNGAELIAGQFLNAYFGIFQLFFLLTRFPIFLNIALLMERILATVLVREYEANNCWLFTMNWILILVGWNLAYIWLFWKISLFLKKEC